MPDEPATPFGFLKDFPNIIKSVTTLLGFLVLSILILLILMAFSLFFASQTAGDDKIFFLNVFYWTLAIMVVIIGSVLIIGSTKPESLKLVRYQPDFSESFAAILGRDLFYALDGYLQNLGEKERTQAYNYLNTVLISEVYIKKSEQEKIFCTNLGNAILNAAEIKYNSKIPEDSVIQ